jgi:hypothetical protein
VVEDSAHSKMFHIHITNAMHGQWVLATPFKVKLNSYGEEKFVVKESAHIKIFYMHITKVKHVLLVLATPFDVKLESNLNSYGVELNPYDPSVANKMIQGRQMMVCW